MKIVFIARSLHFGGAERQLVELATGLRAAGHDVVVLTFYPSGAYGSVLEAKGVRECSLDKQGRWDVLRFGVRLATILRRHAPDVIHSYLGVPNLLTVLLKPFLGEAKIIWGVRASDMDWSHYDLLTRWLHRIEPGLSRYSDLVIVNSHAGYVHAMAQGFATDKLVVIPNGIDVRAFVPDRAAGERVRRQWRIGREQWLIGLVGRVDPIKDHPTFLHAAARSVKSRSDVHFVCVGDGEEIYRNEMVSLGENLGLEKRLRWEESRADVKDVYNALDVLCCASISEGFPNVVAEAMACGVPCVVTDAGDSARIVGDTGIVVPRGDAAALADACERMILRLRREGSSLREAARTRISEQFAVERLVERSIQAIQAIL